MLKGTWRLAAGAAAVAVGVVGVACSSSSGSSPRSGYGSSSGSSGGSEVSDAAEDNSLGEAGEAEAAAPVTSALFVNAMPSGVSGTAEGYGDGSFRFCWSTPGSLILGQPSEDGGGAFPFPTAPMPASNFPGVALGSAVLMPDASSLVGIVTIYAIRSLLLENNKHSGDSCPELLGGTSKELAPNIDYFTLGPVVVKPGVANVIVVEGCLAELYAPGANTQVCGSSWDPALGNLHAEALTAASSGSVDSGPAVQVAQLSTGLAQLLADAGTANLSLAALDPDGGSTTILQNIASVSAEGQILPDAALPLPLDGSLPSYSNLGLRLDLPGNDAGARTFFLTLAQAQQLVDPTVDPRVYYGGQGTYLIGIVGDPNGVPPFATTPEGGTYDGTGLHFLVVQAQPNPL
jgi:hypothetical protein